MDRDEAGRKFREADGQYKAGHFGKALEALNELTAQFPKDAHILFPKALCLSKLGRTEEALAICNTLTGELKYTKAAGLKQQLEQQLQAAPKFNFDISGLDDILGPAPKRTAPPPLPQGRDWKIWWIVGGVAVVLLLLASPLIFGGGDDNDSSSLASTTSPSAAADPPTAQSEQSAPQTPEEAMQNLGPGGYIVGFLVFWFANFWLMIIALGIMKKLPGDTFLENVTDVGVFSAIITLVNVIPVLGFIVELILISKKYDLSCGELVLFVVIQFVIVAALFALLIFVLVGMVATISEPLPALTILHANRIG